MGAALVVIAAYVIAGLIALSFHHDHPAGQTCGWSGCQAKEA
ncbi:hypothetical protein [Janibacter sp. LM]